MSKKSACLKVPKQYGEKALILVSKLQIVDRDLEIQRDKTHIYIPVKSRPLEDEHRVLRELTADLKIATYIFPEKEKIEKSLVGTLANILPQQLLDYLPHSADFVGDIAIIEIPQKLEGYEQAIGEAILRSNKNLQTVLAKAGAISGTYRLRELKLVAGKPTTETIHKEYGCQYHVDLAKVYFSPRLSTEHNRVASLVKEGETVIDLFAGVGPFAVQIAKKHEDVKVYAVDINPDAIDYLKKNIRLNRVEEKIHPILGDAKQVVGKELSGVADRVIMNLPEKASEFMDVACNAAKSEGGIVHFYSFVRASDAIDDLKVRFTKSVEKHKRKVEEALFFRLVRETAPHEWQAVLDARIK